MKKCSKCRTLKYVSEFHINPSYTDGLSSACDPCCAIKDKDRISCRILVGHPAYCKADPWVSDTLRNPKRESERKRAYRFKDKYKYKAQTKVNNAIRDRRLASKPCQICGSTKRIHAHHDDYSKMLDVRWLCPKHHKQWHTENGQGACP